MGNRGNQPQKVGMRLEGLPSLGRLPREYHTDEEIPLLTDQQLQEWLEQTSEMSAPAQKQNTIFVG